MKRLIALGIFGVFLFFSLTIWAQVPQLLNYQGRLTDDKGIPIITPTTVRFSLYQGGDAATPGSGTLVYQEDASVTPDDNGVFSHLIGSGTVIFGALDATVFQTAEPVYLEITIDPEGANETLLPRKQIVTVGYSFKSELADDADTVDGQDAAAFSPVVHNHDADYVNEGQADSVNSSMIVNGTIVDADINAGANIAGSKIDPTGLDADLLDGQDSEDFVHTTGDDMTGRLTINTSAAQALYGTTSHSSGMGVYGWATATSGITYGVYGTTASTSNYASGVYGYASGTSGKVFGVHAISDSPSGYGVLAQATAASGVNFGVFGLSNSPDGIAVKGSNVSTSGNAFGVHGRSDSTSGRGVFGEATATSGTTYGVYGENLSPEGYAVYGTAPRDGVYGRATATSGAAHGVYGESLSDSGVGVLAIATATSGITFGVLALSNSPDGTGVKGSNVATSGSAIGVHGRSDSTIGRAVYGEATATSGANYGVYGHSASTIGKGVYGAAPNYGVYGWAYAATGVNYGVYGQTASSSEYASGVYGEATASTSNRTNGVYGKTDSTSGYGVYGYATATSGSATASGVYGRSDSPRGSAVVGTAFHTTGTNFGVFAATDSPNGYGIWAYAPTGGTGKAGYFSGNVFVTKDLAVNGNFTAYGAKNCVQPIDNGKKVLLYAMESPEIWFEDFGTAQLVNGQAVVQLESVFTQAANTEIAYFVFPIPNGECNGLYISRKDKDSFEVRELGGGTSNISFDYRIVAKRRGYEEVRFEEFTEPEQSPEQANRPIDRKEAKLKQPEQR